MAHRSQLLAVAPALCALHCLATPVVVAAAPAFGKHPAVEWSAFALSALAAAFTFRHAGAPGRRSPAFTAPAGAALAGFTIWLAALAWLHDGPAHTPLLVAGSLTVALALALEVRRERRAANRCACRTCASGADEVTPGGRAAIG